MLWMSNCPSSVAKMMTMAWRAKAEIGCRRDAEDFMHDGSIGSSLLTDPGHIMLHVSHAGFLVLICLKHSQD